jgi:hypothetical protein
LLLFAILSIFAALRQNTSMDSIKNASQYMSNKVVTGNFSNLYLIALAKSFDVAAIIDNHLTINLWALAKLSAAH